MQVLLKADVDHLGYKNDVVDVKRGYWRNYLRPRGLAETATADRVNELTSKMERRRAAEARNEGEAQELKGLLDRTLLNIPMHAGPQGKLYGSVTPADIARAVESARKLRLDPKKIRLEEPIKSLGTFMVPVEVFSGVTAEIKTMVVEAAATEEEKAAMAAAAAQAEADAIAAVEAAEAAAAAAAQAEAEGADAAPAGDEASADEAAATDAAE
jgi:large subunit ribosomal protein L9